MSTDSTGIFYSVNLKQLEKLWFVYFKAFIKAADITEPRGATV